MAGPSMVGSEADRGLEHPDVSLALSEQLERLSGTLRNEIGPAVGDEYLRTQAFMASVILAKLAKEVALAPVHEAAERADLTELHERLGSVLAGAPVDLATAADEAESAGTVAALGPLVVALYDWGTDRPAAAEALSLIRITLRRDIDRRMEIAR